MRSCDLGMVHFPVENLGESMGVALGGARIRNNPFSARIILNCYFAQC